MDTSFERTEHGKDEWLTPPEILHALGEFDPYGDETAIWLQKMAEHQNGIALVFAGISRYVVELDHTNAGIKNHTIRSGHRWKVGDKFSPRVWSEMPYRSNQIIISPDIEIKKIFKFEIKVDGDYVCIFIDDKSFFDYEILAWNDGLSVEDMKSWFKWGTPFEGQIICWNDKIKY